MDEISQYNSFLNIKLSEYNTQITETNNEMQNIDSVLNSEKEKVEGGVQEYKDFKESLEKLSKKLLEKYQNVVDKANSSFAKLQKSLENYKNRIEAKKKELAQHSSTYYNLKNISDNKISKDIEQRIEEHLKFLETSGRL